MTPPPAKPQHKKLTRCNRCFLYFDKILDKCSHCSDLNDDEVKELIAKHKNELASNASVGKYFFMIALFMLFVLFMQL